MRATWLLLKDCWRVLRLYLWCMMGGWGLAIYAASVRRGAWDLPPANDPVMAAYLNKLPDDERAFLLQFVPDN